MNKIAFSALWLVVFLIPTEQQLVIPGFTTGIKLIGLVALILGIIAILTTTGFRRPSPTIVLLTLFVAWCALSITWSRYPENTLQRVITYSADLAFAWLIWEFTGTPRRQAAIIWALLLGFCLCLIDLYTEFLTGRTFSYGERLTGGGRNQNDMAYMGVLLISLSAYLANRKDVTLRFLKLFCWGIIPVIGLSILLTGSRGGTAAMAIAAVILSFSILRINWGARVMLIAAIAASSIMIYQYAPENLLRRVGEGTTSHSFVVRVDTWLDGLKCWLDVPLTGTGAGTFVLAVFSSESAGIVAHNVYVSVLVETGIVGLMLYLGAVLTAFHSAWRMPRGVRTFWVSVCISWFIASMVAPWEYVKITWLLLPLISSVSAVARSSASTNSFLAQPAVFRPGNSRH